MILDDEARVGFHHELADTLRSTDNARLARLMVEGGQNRHSVTVRLAQQLGRLGADATPLAWLTGAHILALAPPESWCAQVLAGVLAGGPAPAVALLTHPEQGLATQAGSARDERGRRAARLDLVWGGPADHLLAPVPGRAADQFMLVSADRLLGWDRHRGAHVDPLHCVSVGAADLDPEGVAFLDADDGRRAHPLVAAQLRHAAYLCGLAGAALDAAVRRARERRQFGMPIGARQAVAFPLAALTAELRAAELLVWHIAWVADHGASAASPFADEESRPLADQVEDAFSLTARLSRHCTRTCLHVHGAYGLTHASSAQELHRRVLFHTAFGRLLPTAGAARRSDPSPTSVCGVGQ